MLKRTDKENLERKTLSEFACLSANSKGREIHEEPCEFRTDFQRDRDRIIHSKAFRRLMDKTQVFINPDGDHYRRRLTHTIEVSMISRIIASSLALNEDLTESIAMGHDLGHTPFGHAGEEVLDKIHRGGFEHNQHSLRIVEKIETTEKRRGLNLTFEVRDGILHHTGDGIPVTLEGQIVKIADRIAYINHDIDDAIRAGILKEDDLPEALTNILGHSKTERINTLVSDMILESDGKGKIFQSKEKQEAMNALRNFMMENVYLTDKARPKTLGVSIENIITSLYNYYIENPAEVSEELQPLLATDGKEEVAKDMIAGMTDNFAIKKYKEIFISPAEI